MTLQAASAQRQAEARQALRECTHEGDIIYGKLVTKEDVQGFAYVRLYLDINGERQDMTEVIAAAITRRTTKSGLLQVSLDDPQFVRSIAEHLGWVLHKDMAHYGYETLRRVGSPVTI